MERPFRSYTIERDSDGKPCRMIWNGDFRKVPVVYETCPKCKTAQKLVEGRCLTCWGDWRGESTWERV